jgi:hypothetical protein
MVQSVQDGLKKYSNQYRNEFNTKTNNGRHFITWDFINTELDVLPEYKFETIVSKRGMWELVLIYDKETKWLYTLMKDKRLKQLQQSVKKDGIHYLEALASLNADLNDLEYEQLSMFELTSEDRKDCINKTLDEMIHTLKSDVERYALITFADINYEITSISAYIMTEQLEIVSKENWEEYIQAEFDLVINPIEKSHIVNNEEIEDIPLLLKVISSNDLVAVKSTEKQKQEQTK